MAKQPTWLVDFKRDVHSQAGEDGIVEKIFQILPASDRWCVEFGAWDGLHLSNTRYLIETRGYSAVLIEGSAAKFDELRQNYAANRNVFGLHAFVGYTAGDNLDTLLSKYAIPVDFDFLSIDVDGNDFHIWKAMSKYRPKVIVIEFNPTIPTEVRIVQRADSAINQGSSLSALVELGRDQGYELVAALHHNAFFVDAKYFALFEINDNRPQALRTDLSSITYIFSGFDGTLFLEGQRKLPWHGVPLMESKIQHLPKYLRKYPLNFSAAEMIVARAYAGWSFPRRLWHRVQTAFSRRSG